MVNLPVKYSKKWMYIMVVLFLLTFSALIAVGVILEIDIGAENISGFAFLSLVVSIGISVGGYLGAWAYFYTALVFNILGIVYMLYVSINRTAEGWSDLVSIISYLFTLGLGISLGILIQSVITIRSKRSQN